MFDRGNKADTFDVGYGLASASITAGLNAISTTGAAFYGISIVASATVCLVTIYDSVSATAGNVLDVFSVATGSSFRIDRYIPVMAKKGITVGVGGAGAVGTVIYGPKG